jgi:glycerol-3-phosphate dehydrogenase
LDAKAAMEAAPVVASLMANLMGKDDGWVKKELESFSKVAEKYLPEV